MSRDTKGAFFYRLNASLVALQERFLRGVIHEILFYDSFSCRTALSFSYFRFFWWNFKCAEQQDCCPIDGRFRPFRGVTETFFYMQCFIFIVITFLHLCIDVLVFVFMVCILRTDFSSAVRVARSNATWWFSLSVPESRFWRPPPLFLSPPNTVLICLSLFFVNAADRKSA